MDNCDKDMVTLKILDKEIEEIIENISLETAFTTIADYGFENMIDEPKVNDMTNIGNTLVLYGDDVTFEIKDYCGEEKI